MFTVDTATSLVTQGGPASLSFHYNMRNADPSGMVSPYTTSRGRYQFSVRSGADGEPVYAVGLASKAAHINHMEQGLLEMIRDGDPHLGRMNRIEVDYGDIGTVTDLDLPGKAFDTHIRAATKLGTSELVDSADEYRRACIEGPDLDLSLLNLSPNTRVGGGWESRRANGAKVPSIIRGETYAILTDQARDASGAFRPHRQMQGGWRTDPLISGDSSVDAKTEVAALVKRLSGLEFTKNSTKWKKLSEVGIGNTPGEGSAGVAAREIHRVTTINLPLIRSIVVSEDAARNTAVRRVVLAHALVMEAAGANRAHYRAGCLLEVDAGAARCRYGVVDTEVPTLPDALSFLDDMLAAAGNDVPGWGGVVYATVGNPDIKAKIEELRKLGDDSAKSAES